MKIGTLVRNKYAVRTNPVVQEALGCEEVPAGFLGVVVDVREAELNAVFGELHYMGSHWLSSFANYLETQRGVK